MSWFCKLRGEICLGDKKLYKYRGGDVCLSVLTGIAGLFQSGPSSKQEACFARWGGDGRIFAECQQKPKWRVESHHHRALLCICNLSLQSHYYMLWQGLEHAMGVVSKKVDGPSGAIRQGKGKELHITYAWQLSLTVSRDKLNLSGTSGGLSPGTSTERLCLG